VRVIRQERVNYACPCCDGGLRLAARPAQVIPKGLFTERALAWMATTKYLDGLPLYRLAALLGRFGGTDISRNTVAGSIVRVGQGVQPVINLMRDELLDAPLVFGDETERQMLKEPGRAAQTKSYVWAQMTDGYDIYDKVAQTQGLVHLACWAHCRRCRRTSAGQTSWRRSSWR
jgi:transposase